MKINTNLKNVFIKVNLSNIEDVLPLALLFPQSTTGNRIIEGIGVWKGHFSSPSSSNVIFLINDAGRIKYETDYTGPKCMYYKITKEYRELKSYKELSMTLKERIKEFTI